MEQPQFKEELPLVEEPETTPEQQSNVIEGPWPKRQEEPESEPENPDISNTEAEEVARLAELRQEIIDLPEEEYNEPQTGGPGGGENSGGTSSIESFTKYKTCDVCGGSGRRWIAFSCPACGGIGRVPESATTRYEQKTL